MYYWQISYYGSGIPRLNCVKLYELLVEECGERSERDRKLYIVRTFRPIRV